MQLIAYYCHFNSWIFGKICFHGKPHSELRSRSNKQFTNKQKLKTSEKFFYYNISPELVCTLWLASLAGLFSLVWTTKF